MKKKTALHFDLECRGTVDLSGIWPIIPVLLN